MLTPFFPFQSAQRRLRAMILAAAHHGKAAASSQAGGGADHGPAAAVPVPDQSAGDAGGPPNGEKGEPAVEQAAAVLRLEESSEC